MDFSSVAYGVLSIIATLIMLFGAKWGISRYAKKIARAALEGKKYSKIVADVNKEVDDVFTVVAADFGDGDISLDDLKRAFEEGKDVWEVVRNINAKAKKKG